MTDSLRYDILKRDNYRPRICGISAKDGEQLSEHINNKLVVGILAHVDAGKTTLAEGMLYVTGSIRKLGRVDHKDAFLDTNDIERARGITIFSKQAQMNIKDREVTLLDTPGHMDFSAEMERTLQVLDYAILVINGADKIEGHVLTLWKLLSRYNIPTFIFVNKMDQDMADKNSIMESIKKKLDINCVDFSKNLGNMDLSLDVEIQDSSMEILKDEEILENIAMCDEDLMEKYLDTGKIDVIDVIEHIKRRNLFPCFFGSALKLQGVKEFIDGLYRFTACKNYPSEFGAKVYKITRDAKGNRLTHLKVTGGTLSVKQVIAMSDGTEEKINQICIYSGDKCVNVNEVVPGTVCAVIGLTMTYAGQCIGDNNESMVPYIEPVLSYEIILPEECDVHKTYLQFKQLQEEEPQLQIEWNEKLNAIYAKVMGEIQIEVLKNIIKERFDLDVEFNEGSIVYKETISDVVEGVGHFEPLRHYAEVHLLMEPAKRGEGLIFDTNLSEDMLERNWQRLILTHLQEKQHIGVLTGSEITDMKITLVAGKAHLKHTEGGDFRQATYRAIRQGLKQAKITLLEPIYEYRLEIPNQCVSRALSDIQKMHGTFEGPGIEGDMSIITGRAPVICMQGYATSVTSYTHGEGSIYYEYKGYAECHNQEEVVESIGYEDERDADNPSSSVFCSHGSGYNVPWNEVKKHMHIEGYFERRERLESSKEGDNASCVNERRVKKSSEYAIGVREDKELEDIFFRTYGDTDRRLNNNKNRRSVEVNFSKKSAKDKDYKYNANVRKEEYLLVDGYNIIFAWKELDELATIDLGAARNKLMDILCNYQGYRKKTVILVFDAYKVEGNVGEVFKYHNINVVYTKHSETADRYIEKVVRHMAKDYDVTVATSDILEQVIITGEGARKISAIDFKKEIEVTRQSIKEIHMQATGGDKTYLFDTLPKDRLMLIEEIRLGRKNGNR